MMMVMMVMVMVMVMMMNGRRLSAEIAEIRRFVGSEM